MDAQKSLPSDCGIDSTQEAKWILCVDRVRLKRNLIASSSLVDDRSPWFSLRRSMKFRFFICHFRRRERERERLFLHWYHRNSSREIHWMKTSLAPLKTKIEQRILKENFSLLYSSCQIRLKRSRSSFSFCSPIQSEESFKVRSILPSKFSFSFTIHFVFVEQLIIVLSSMQKFESDLPSLDNLLFFSHSSDHHRWKFELVYTG